MEVSALSSQATAGLASPRQPPTAGEAQPTKSVNVTAQATQPAGSVQPSRQELDKAVKSVNDFVSTVNNTLNFSIDEDTGTTVVKVIDNTTKEVIKQIPSEEMLVIAKALDNLKGLLVQQKA
jgi:flagellar protein FlaG